MVRPSIASLDRCTEVGLTSYEICPNLIGNEVALPAHWAAVLDQPYRSLPECSFQVHT